MIAGLLGLGMGLLGASGKYDEAKKLAKQTQAEKDALAIAGDQAKYYTDTFKGDNGVNQSFLNMVQQYGTGAYQERLAAHNAGQAMQGLQGQRTARTDPSQANYQKQMDNSIGGVRANVAGGVGSSYLQGQSKLAEGLGYGIDLGNKSLGLAVNGTNSATQLGTYNATQAAQNAANQWGALSSIGQQMSYQGAKNNGSAYKKTLGKNDSANYMDALKFAFVG